MHLPDDRQSATLPPFQPMAALKWLAVLLPMSAVIGSASAFFLWSLDAVTRVRFSHPWLLWLLPLAGLAIGWMYHRHGSTSSGGNNLLIDEIHLPGGGIPRRMAPLILISTLLTHLFGGSAGREGTAVQMGGGIAASFARVLKPDPVTVRILLMAGVAAGFGSVFGTPVAGTIFALEVLVIGRIQYDALIPCFIASLTAHWTCTAWGVGHTTYEIAVSPDGSHADPVLFAKVALAAVIFGLAARAFSWSTHRLSASFNRLIPRPELRPFVGGLVIVGFVFVAGTNDYLGLGVLADRPGAITLPAMFVSTDIPPSAWAWKFIFTVLTIAAGFKGGEVTPLFFIGAALGNTLALIAGAPIDLFAAIGFIAIFAGATNTPLASTLLGMELFGAANGLYLATACIIAYRFSGHTGIYSSQRLATPKFHAWKNHN